MSALRFRSLSSWQRYAKVGCFAALCLMFLLSSACTPISAPTPTTSVGSADHEVIATLISVEGDVELLLPAATRRVSGLMSILIQSQRARPMQPVQRNTTVRAGAEGRVTIICANNRVIVVGEHGQVIVTEQSCNQGQPLPPDASRRVTPDNGQIKVNQGSAELEDDAREKEGDYGRLPIILSPRHTGLIELEPPIVWVNVPEAIEYVLQLSGPGSYEEITLEATSLTCREDARVQPNRICTTAWPTSTWGALTAGKRYFLTVSARLTFASPLRDSAKSTLRVLNEAALEQIKTGVAATQELKLDAITTNLLLAGLYAEQGIQAQNAGLGLYAQAIPLYEEVVQAQPSPVVYVTLGDAYRAVDLQRFAFKAYQKAIELIDPEVDDPSVRAAAEFGMGQVEYSRLNFKTAEPHFVQAVELYKQLNAVEELRAAQKALDETLKRI